MYQVPVRTSDTNFASRNLRVFLNGEKRAVYTRYAGRDDCALHEVLLFFTTTKLARYETSRILTSTGSCERGNKYSVSLKGTEFLWLTERLRGHYATSQKVSG
jgi:hypothetical protein